MNNFVKTLKCIDFTLEYMYSSRMYTLIEYQFDLNFFYIKRIRNPSAAPVGLGGGGGGVLQDN